METKDDFGLMYYDQRLEEFELLLSNTNSHTLKELIVKAKEDTESSLDKYVKVQKMTLVILTAQKITNEKRLGQYTLELKKVSLEMATGRFDKHNGNYLVEYYSNFISQIKAKAGLDMKLYDLRVKVYSLALEEFKKVLFQLIYKPNNASFHYESILDCLQILVSKMIPYLDELKTLRMTIPSIRKQEFTKTGDKIILYLEQYIDALEKWDKLVIAYIDLLDQ